MKKPSLFAGVMIAVLPALAAAQAGSFRAIDRNGDGYITSEEWYGQRGVAPVPFSILDVNGDGRISESEFREWSSARGSAGIVGITPADRFRVIDRNKDNVISAKEWGNGMLSLTPFESVDRNKDGTISRSEFMAWDQQRGGPVAANPGTPAGAAAPVVSDLLRQDRGVAGPAGPAGVVGPSGAQMEPVIPSSTRPQPGSAVTNAPGIADVPGAGSPALGTGAANVFTR